LSNFYDVGVNRRSSLSFRPLSQGRSDAWDYCVFVSFVFLFLLGTSAQLRPGLCRFSILFLPFCSSRTPAAASLESHPFSRCRARLWLPGPTWRLARFTRPPTAAADVGRCRKMGRPPCARTRYIPRPLCVSLVKVSNSTPVCSRNQSSLGFRYYFLLVNLELSTITSLS